MTYSSSIAIHRFSGGLTRRYGAIVQAERLGEQEAQPQRGDHRHLPGEPLGGPPGRAEQQQDHHRRRRTTRRRLLRLRTRRGACRGPGGSAPRTPAGSNRLRVAPAGRAQRRATVPGPRSAPIRFAPANVAGRAARPIRFRSPAGCESTDAGERFVSRTRSVTQDQRRSPVRRARRQNPLPAVEQEGDRAVVDQGNLHVRAEPAGRREQAGRPQFGAEPLVQPVRLGRRGGGG